MLQTIPVFSVGVGGDTCLDETCACDQLRTITSSPLRLPPHFPPCPSNDRQGGKYTRSEFPCRSHPDLEPTWLRQMSQLDHGDALWLIAQFSFLHPT